MHGDAFVPPLLHLFYFAGLLGFTLLSYVVFFFFQAEDGIRDIGVTGVQTCALPIFDAQHKVTPDRRDGTCTSRQKHRDERFARPFGSHKLRTILSFRRLRQVRLLPPASPLLPSPSWLRRHAWRESRRAFGAFPPAISRCPAVR